LELKPTNKPSGGNGTVVKSERKTLAMKRKRASEILGRLNKIARAKEAELADQERKARIAEKVVAANDACAKELGAKQVLEAVAKRKAKAQCFYSALSEKRSALHCFNEKIVWILSTSCSATKSS
jgi:hypothetical protein